MPLASSMTFCPAMSLAGVRVSHSWVDGRMRIIGYEQIQSDTAFRASGLTLGQAVHAVVKHLQLYPPEVLEITDRGLEAIQFKQKQNQANSGSSAPGRPPSSSGGGRIQEAPPDYSLVDESKKFSPVPDVPMPPTPNRYVEIDDLSREELDHLLEDELDFLSLVRKLDTFKEIHATASSVLDENVRLANANMSHEGLLAQRHAEVVQLQAQLRKKVEQFQQLERQQNALCAPPDKRLALKQLNKAKRQAFDESERVAEEWVESGGSVDDFVRQFLEMRVVHHKRAAKMELLQQSNHLQ
jgi:ESCRT-I complex subunit VPS37